MFATLNAPSDGTEAIERVIAELDACFLNGFVGAQSPAIASLSAIFAGTPLQSRIESSIEALTRNEFVESHFVTLAAARTALQGTWYDVLRHQAVSALDRQHGIVEPPVKIPVQADTLLDSIRHWLMELALTGFARLETDSVQSFTSTLSQLRANPQTASQAALLTGLVNEILAALPVKDADQVPLLRWCDLWSRAMLNAVGTFDSPAPTPVSGTLYPLGLELRQHSRLASVVVYGVLEQADSAMFVRQTWSSFKVAAIQGDEVWLLFPEAQLILQNLLQGKALVIKEMPMLPSGDLLWSADATETGKKFKPLDIALKYCAPGSSLIIPPVPPLERHPVQLAEPVALSQYSIEGNVLRLKDGTTIALETRRASLPGEALAATTMLFGLLRYDAGAWSIQVLTADNASGKFEFVGQAGAELLKKPPKSSTVSILKERASRLLRKSRS